MNAIEIMGANMCDEYKRIRVACRAYIEQDGKLLVSQDVQLGIMLTPGGGLEGGESLEECCAREVAEEAGLIVEIGREAAQVTEYYGDFKYETHYFVCKIIGRCERRLTELEAEHGLVTKWVDKNVLAKVWSEYNCCCIEEKRGSYLREYKALEEYFKLDGEQAC